MFYNSGINFQKNINIYKELKDFSDFKSSYVKHHKPSITTFDKNML